MKARKQPQISRTISFLIVVCLLGLPAHAQYGGGRGTADDPYQIWTAEQMNTIGAEPGDWDKHFKLMNDLDMGEVDPNEIMPIGDPIIMFTGVFDGVNHTIDDFTCRQQDLPYVGMFGVVVAPKPDPNGVVAVVRNLHLVNVQVCGRDYVGGLVAWNRGTIRGCSVEGSISGVSRVGAVTGVNQGELNTCRSAGTVTATSDRAGGIAGENSTIVSNIMGPLLNGNGWACISRSCSSAQVTGQSMVGGLVGVGNGGVRHCYAEGSVSGHSRVGGIIGNNSSTLEFCYSTARVVGEGSAGGLTGTKGYATAAFCLWDMETSGIGISAAGKGRTTAEMMNAATYYCWGADGLWTLDEGNDYPRLAWENRGGLPIGEYDRRYGGGSGTADDPYQIRTTGQFITAGWYHKDFDKHFALMEDLDFNDVNPAEIKPIGSAETAFTGEFDGRGHTLSRLALTGYRDYVGVVGVLGTRVGRGLMHGPGSYHSHIDAPGFVHDLHVSDARMSGGDFLSGLVGFNVNGAVSNCSVTGLIAGNWWSDVLGGLVGRNMGLVTNCRASCSVKGQGFIGGLVGSNYATIEQSYSTGEVTGSDYHVGGLVGDNSGIISCCYSHCAVQGGEGVGGLVGSGSGRVTFSYAAGKVAGKELVGGLLGEDHGSSPCVYSYWDIETSSVSQSGGGAIGKTTAELQTASTFLDAGWDFMGETANGTGDIWWILEGKDYPRLWWEREPGEDNGPEDGGPGSEFN